MKNSIKGSLGALAFTSLALLGMPAANAVGEDAQATQVLTSQVYSSVSNNDYSADGGGFIKGSQLLQQDESGIYQINQGEYDKLSSKGKQDLASDIVDSTDQAKQDGAQAGVTDSTVTNWYKSLQTTDGFGSQLLAKTMEQTKPDFNTAAQIYAPFSGPISTAMGFLTLVMFGLLGLTIVFDLLFIAVPMARILFGDGSDDKGESKTQLMSKVISFAARSAVKAEESDDGGNKSALWIYFKKSFVKFLLVGLCLVYLISGQLWIFVGWMLDLVSGVTGF